MLRVVEQIYDYFVDNVKFIIKQIGNKSYFFVFAGCVSFVTRLLKINGKKLNSPALLADSEHYKVDLVTNINWNSYFIVMVLENPILDPLIAFVFSIYIIYGALGLVKNKY